MLLPLLPLWTMPLSLKFIFSRGYVLGMTRRTQKSIFYFAGRQERTYRNIQPLFFCFFSYRLKMRNYSRIATLCLCRLLRSCAVAQMGQEILLESTYCSYRIISKGIKS